MTTTGTIKAAPAPNGISNLAGLSKKGEISSGGRRSRNSPTWRSISERVHVSQRGRNRERKERRGSEGMAGEERKVLKREPKGCGRRRPIEGKEATRSLRRPSRSEWESCASKLKHSWFLRAAATTLRLVRTANGARMSYYKRGVLTVESGVGYQR